MVDRPIQSKKRYLISFIIAVVIFAFIFGISYSISYLEFQRVSSLQDQSAYQIFEDKIAQSFFAGELCSYESFEKISQDLNFQGRMIDEMEKKFGKNDESVLFRKRFYTLVQLEHFDFVNLINKNCNSTAKIILFFYSNEPKETKASERVGNLIGFVATKHSNLMVYSFDLNLESNLISSLKTKYNITDSPSIIVEDNFVFDPQTSDEIEKYLN